MPTKKKRAFTKKNSVKYIVLHGHETALNADGKTLEHEWVKVEGNYKPGSSLFMGRIAELAAEFNSTTQADTPPTHPNIVAKPSKGPNLEAILDQLPNETGSDDEDLFSDMSNELRNIQFASNIERLNQGDFIVEEEYEENDGEFLDEECEFSDSDFNLSETSRPDELSLQKEHMKEGFENHGYDAFFSSLEQNYAEDSSTENLTIAEEQIEKKVGEYEDDQIGPLEDEEICGYLTGDNKHINYFLGKKKEEDEEIEIGNCGDALKEKILKYSEEEHVEKFIEIVTEHPPDFDCESFISTYSNKYNHPAIIREEGKIRKIKIPNNPLQNHLTKSKLKQLESDSESEECSDDDVSIASTINTRPKGETPEQRQERKKLFKQIKSENRKLKKENKIAFKTEKKFQQAQAINVQNNRGIRLF